MFKLFKKVRLGNVQTMKFDDRREQAIYNAGMNAGERQANLESVVSDILMGIAGLVVIKLADYGLRKLLADEGQENVLLEYFEEDEY